ncbi:hypothetical protein UFOVP1655_118 [uncultured Caudovirales phage]|uniref:Uncharacterized protein n=1 Tax=uncultured Caudovirales phage TaxID=2100421 RepID=A0A6J5T6J8_9CAUD|nr:hypothetical protein UFOVP1655_118 [uncultured Caudovirales phage]
MNEDNYILELAPDEHYLLIQALVLLSDTCTTFCKDQDPLIDKIRIEITNAWAKRFQKEDINNIKELLAQPETEQKPVVWQVVGIAGFMYVYNQPIDQVYEHHTVNALYLAPPKRKPLTSKLISLGNNCHESFIKGVRFAEKMHGITGVDDE